MSLFFVLSSYLITELLLRERETTGTIHIKNFYVRRILRIWPLYFAFIALTWVLGHYAYSWLAGNWYLIYIDSGFAGPLMPLWSISLEEQFYLLWPTLSRYCSRRTFVLTSTALMLMGIGSIVLLTHEGWPIYRIWWNSFVQFMFFGLGALLAFYTHFQLKPLSRLSRLLLLFGGLAAWWAGGCLNTVASQEAMPTFPLVATYLCAAIGCVAFLLALLGIRVKWPDALIYLGKISYGLYVFHVLCPDVIAQLLRILWPSLLKHGSIYKPAYMILGLAFTIITAHYSYNWFEKPFLKLKERFALVQSRPA